MDRKADRLGNSRWSEGTRHHEERPSITRNEPPTDTSARAAFRRLETSSSLVRAGNTTRSSSDIPNRVHQKRIRVISYQEVMPTVDGERGDFRTGEVQGNRTWPMPLRGAGGARCRDSVDWSPCPVRCPSPDVAHTGPLVPVCTLPVVGAALQPHASSRRWKRPMHTTETRIPISCHGGQRFPRHCATTGLKTTLSAPEQHLSGCAQAVGAGGPPGPCPR